MKGGNKDALQSGRDRYAAKITLQTEFFLWFPFSLVILLDFLKICIIISSLPTIKYGQKDKKKKKC